MLIDLASYLYLLRPFVSQHRLLRDLLSQLLVEILAERLCRLCLRIWIFVIQPSQAEGFKPIVVCLRELSVEPAKMQLFRHFTGLRKQQLLELVDQPMAEAIGVEQLVVLGLQLITIVMEYSLLKERLLFDLNRLIQLRYARCLN
jgi:hypothetical protein